MKLDQCVFDSTVAMLLLLSFLVSIGAVPTLCAGNRTMLLQVQFPGKQTLEFSVQGVSLGIFWDHRCGREGKEAGMAEGKEELGSRLSKPPAML